MNISAFKFSKWSRPQKPWVRPYRSSLGPTLPLSSSVGVPNSGAHRTGTPRTERPLKVQLLLEAHRMLVGRSSSRPLPDSVLRARNRVRVAPTARTPPVTRLTRRASALRVRCCREGDPTRTWSRAASRLGVSSTQAARVRAGRETRGCGQCREVRPVRRNGAREQRTRTGRRAEDLFARRSLGPRGSLRSQPTSATPGLVRRKTWTPQVLDVPVEEAVIRVRK